MLLRRTAIKRYRNRDGKWHKEKVLQINKVTESSQATEMRNIKKEFS